MSPEVIWWPAHPCTEKQQLIGCFSHHWTGTFYMEEWRQKRKKEERKKKKGKRGTYTDKCLVGIMTPVRALVFFQKTLNKPQHLVVQLWVSAVYFSIPVLIPMHCLCLALLSIPSATEYNWKNKNPRLHIKHVQGEKKKNNNTTNTTTAKKTQQEQKKTCLNPSLHWWEHRQ